MFIAITTYGKPEDTYYQVMNMYDKKHIYYIHYNRRETRKNLKKLRDLFSKYPNVNVISKYKVYWGEISITKSTINMMRIFLKSNEDHFIHLGAKEINIKPINMIEKILKKLNNVNYMNFDKNYIIDYCVERKSFFDYYNKHSDIFYRHNFKKYLYRFTTTHNKLKYLIIFSYILKNIFSKSILQIIKFTIKKDKRKLFEYLFYYMDDNNEVQESELNFNKKIKKMPKNLKNIKFIVRRQVGPILMLNKSDIYKILNSNIYKSLYRYSKKCLAPEEFIFHTLYFNIIGNTKCSKNPLAQNILENEPGFINDNYDKEDFLFLRRVVGEKNINKINKTKWLKTKN